MVQQSERLMRRFLFPFLLIFLLVFPVNASADSKTKQQVLSYLISLPSQASKKVLSGQFIGYCGNENPNLFDRIHAKSGHYPAVMSGNYGEFSGCVTGADTVKNTNPYLEAHWAAGGLVEIAYHGNNPATGTWNNDIAPNFVDLVTPGTAINTAWKAQLDRLAVGLQDLEDAKVVVLFRPFVEITGDWFWWGLGTAAEIKNMWIYTHDYLEKTKGLSNLLWVFAGGVQPWGHTASSIYPGSAYVDIVGVSSYPESTQHGSMASWYTGWSVTDVQYLLGTGKPFAFAEMGLCNYEGCASPQYLPTIISDIKTYVPNAVYWSNWNSTWSMDYGTDVSTLLNDSWVVNREDDPALTIPAQRRQPSPPVGISIR